MTQDHQPIEDQAGEQQPIAREPAPARRRSGPGPIVIAGVFGACVLGVGMGLWARPSDPTKEVVARPAPVTPARPAALQIVVADEPAPIGQPLEVLPGDFAEPTAPATPEVISPHRTASGLVKVDAPIAAAPLVVLEPAPQAEPALARPAPVARPQLAPRPAPVVKLRQADAEAVKAKEKARAEKARAEKARMAKAEAGKARLAKARLAETRAADAKAKKAAELAAARKAEKARATRLAKLEKEKAAKARLAKAEAAGKKAEPRKLAAVVKAVKSAPKKLKDAAARKKPVELAAAKPKPKAKPVAKTRKPPPRVETAARTPPPKRVVVPRGEGPMRVARANPCANVDPGEAIVCADPRLSARERQLQQAYRNAEAAGVPASALRRQQARWQQARAAAARDAPWAVEDVYVARISELNDLTRDAREN